MAYQLNQVSIEAANELQQETGKSYVKPSYRTKDSVNKVTGKISFEEFQKQKVSNDFVEEVQKRKGKLNPYDLLLADSNHNIVGVWRLRKYSEAPPTRLLCMTLILCYWLGYHDADKGHELQKKEDEGIGARNRIENAYDSGFAANSSQPNAKIEATVEPLTNQDENEKPQDSNAKT
jgi:hypothetical protein